MTVVSPIRMPTEMTLRGPVCSDVMNAVASEGSSACGQILVGDHSRQGQGHQDVQNGHDGQAAEDAARKRLLRVRTSSALVATTSKPIKAKNTSAAPARMPVTPYC